MRNRVIYQSEAAYVGPTPATGFHFNSGASGNNLINQLQRVQVCNYSFGAKHKDVNQFGELAAIDRVIIDPPDATIDLTYILANLTNESYLGFVVDGSSSCISGILNKTRDERNYFLKIVGEGVDAVNDLTAGSPVFTVGIGNGFLSSYSTKGSVGNFPTVDIKVEGLNALIIQGNSGFLPAVNPIDGSAITSNLFVIPTTVSSPGTGNLALSALRPGDITITLAKRSANGSTGTYDYMGPSITDAKIQSYDFTMNLTREPILRLGSKYAFSREIRFPVEVTSTIEAVLGDLVTGNLTDFVTADSSYDMLVNIFTPATVGVSARTLAAQYILRNAKLNLQSYTSNIGNNKTVRLDFTSQIGGPNQTGIGFFMSGIAASPAS
jgi:hypothetical protein